MNRRFFLLSLNSSWSFGPATQAADFGLGWKSPSFFEHSTVWGPLPVWPCSSGCYNWASDQFEYERPLTLLHCKRQTVLPPLSESQFHFPCSGLAGTWHLQISFYKLKRIQLLWSFLDPASSDVSRVAINHSLATLKTEKVTAFLYALSSLVLMIVPDSHFNSYTTLVLLIIEIDTEQNVTTDWTE